MSGFDQHKQGQEPELSPTELRQFEEWKSKLVRPASRMIIGGFPPPEDPRTSWFGCTTLQDPEEEWPLSKTGPMFPLCQILTSELPFVPDDLQDIALIQIFIAPDFNLYDTNAGQGWCLRTSTSLDPLVPATPPEFKSEIKPLPVRWELLENDLPSFEDLPDDFPDRLHEKWWDSFCGADGSKVGGWPTLVQSEIYWAPWNLHPANPRYVLQIDTEKKANWMWGNCGVGYFGRGTEDHRDNWTMSWQPC